MMLLITSFNLLEKIINPFASVNEDVVMHAINKAEEIEEGKFPKRVSDNLASQGFILTRTDCMPDPKIPSGLTTEESAAAISLHYAYVKIFFLICWLNNVNSSDKAAILEVVANEATDAKTINDAIQKLCNEFPFVSVHMAIITAMRVRALSLNPFQESIGVTPEFNQTHVNFKVLTAPVNFSFNMIKDSAIKEGTYSKKLGSELIDSFNKKICHRWNFISALYEIKISDFNLSEMAFFMRMSGYQGSVQAEKASKSDLKTIVFPIIMKYLLSYLSENQDIWTKPFLTKGKERLSYSISQQELDVIELSDLHKYHLHDFLAGEQLIRKIAKKIKDTGKPQEGDVEQ